LFEDFESLQDEDSSERKRLFEDIADRLAIHATIEERHFYPAVRQRQTEEILDESLVEHLGIKHILAELMVTDSSDDVFDERMELLRDEVEHHVDEEEGELFPRVKRLFDEDTLADLE